MTTAYLLFPLLLLLSVHIQKLQSELYEIKYTSSTLMCLGSFIIFSCLGFAGASSSLNFEFFTDFRFYISQALLVALIVVQIEGRKQCENNIPLFNFSSFLIISAAPIASWIVVSILPFKNTVEIKYDSLLSMFGMCAATLLLTVIYYRNKIKTGNITSLQWLVLNILVGTFSIVMHAKLIQEFDPFSYLISTNGINIVVFFLLAYRNNEWASLSKAIEFKKGLSSIVAVYCATQFLNTLIVTKIPVEHYVTLRSAGLILIGYAYYYVLDRKVLFTLRDVIVLCCMIATQWLFTR